MLLGCIFAFVMCVYVCDVYLYEPLIYMTVWQVNISVRDVYYSVWRVYAWLQSV